MDPERHRYEIKRDSNNNILAMFDVSEFEFMKEEVEKEAFESFLPSEEEGEDDFNDYCESDPLYDSLEEDEKEMIGVITDAFCEVCNTFGKALVTILAKNKGRDSRQN